MNSNIIKLNPESYENTVKRIVELLEYESYESYTYEHYNSKGKKIKYDSQNREVIMVDAGYILNTSKYLLLILL